MTLKEMIRLALSEDIGTGDITTEYLDLTKRKTTAYLIAKQEGICCGLDMAFASFKEVDETIKCVAYKKDGDRLKPKDTIAKIEGYPCSILQGERVALNFLQRLSGIATLTDQFVEAIKPHKAKLLDTRKTTPLLRKLEKYAVKVGGGYNHRFGLYDMVLIKENHIRAAGSIKKAVEAIRKHNTSYKIEVEVTNLDELRKAIKCLVDRIMLDNMSIEMMKEAVEIIQTSNIPKLIETEASGGVNLETINEIAATGVDYISCGAITHSYKSCDISLLFSKEDI